MEAIWCDVYISGTFQKKVKFRPPLEDFADLQEAVWNSRKASLHYCGAGDLDVYPAGTSMPPHDVQCFGSDSALPPGVNLFVVVAPEDPQRIEGRKRKMHVLKLLETAQDAFSESGTRKPDRLLRVRAHDNGSKTCFLCTSQDKVEASHVFRKSDVSFRRGQKLGYKTLEILRDWRDGHNWRRPFEMHGPMNLIWLCHTHSLQFDAHNFCLKIDLHNRALFHAFDNSFDVLVEQANARLLDCNDAYYDMSYVSRRAIGMRILQSQERGGRFIDHDNPDSRKAIVSLSSAASVAARYTDETEGSNVSTGHSSQDLDGFDEPPDDSAP